MAYLTMKQVGQYAKQAGFSGHNLAVAIAVSTAEDGSHNPSVLGDVSLETAKWGPSVGLWQIRSLKAEYGTGQDRDQRALTNPGFNARAAYRISGGSNFGAWTTYTHGTYLRYMSEATAIANELEGASGSPAPPKTQSTPPHTNGLLFIMGLAMVTGAGYWAYTRYGQGRWKL